jgi:hypothetical protein
VRLRRRHATWLRRPRGGAQRAPRRVLRERCWTRWAHCVKRLLLLSLLELLLMVLEMLWLQLVHLR